MQSQKPLEFTTNKNYQKFRGDWTMYCINMMSIQSENILIVLGCKLNVLEFKPGLYSKSAQDSKEKIFQCVATLDFLNFLIKLFFSDCLLH